MANTVTAHPNIPCNRYNLTLLSSPVIPLTVSIDTPNVDVDLRTATSGQYWMLIGLEYATSAAHILTFKSNSNLIIAYDMPANSRRNERIGNPILCTRVGEALKVQSSAAITFLAHVQSFSGIRL